MLSVTQQLHAAGLASAEQPYVALDLLRADDSTVRLPQRMVSACRVRTSRLAAPVTRSDISSTLIHGRAIGASHARLARRWVSRLHESRAVRPSAVLTMLANAWPTCACRS